MMGWDCAECGKEIEDTRYQREQSLGDKFIKGESSFCLECANLVYDRESGRFLPRDSNPLARNSDR